MYYQLSAWWCRMFQRLCASGNSTTTTTTQIMTTAATNNMAMLFLSTRYPRNEFYFELSFVTSYQSNQKTQLKVTRHGWLKPRARCRPRSIMLDEKCFILVEWHSRTNTSFLAAATNTNAKLFKSTTATWLKSARFRSIITVAHVARPMKWSFFVSTATVATTTSAVDKRHHQMARGPKLHCQRISIV